MKRIALLLMLATVACRRTHPPGPGAEPEVPTGTETAPPATENAPPTTENAPPTGASATRPTTARLPMPDGGTLNGDPRGPRQHIVRAALDAALVDVRACFDASPELKNGEVVVNVHFFVEPPGYTGAVTVKADAPKDVVDCTRSVYEKLKLPEFRGAKLELAPSFTYWKRAVGDGGAKK